MLGGLGFRGFGGLDAETGLMKLKLHPPSSMPAQWALNSTAVLSFDPFTSGCLVVALPLLCVTQDRECFCQLLS